MRKSTKKNNVTLRKKELSNGNVSLYLDVYRDGVRKYEFLKLYVNGKARTPLEREHNRATLAMAEEIRTKREAELNAGAYDINTLANLNVDFIAFFEAYNKAYNKKDYRMMTGTLRRFKDFLVLQYGNRYSSGIRVRQIDKEMVAAFVEYLKERSEGEGASNYYQKFKKVVKCAVDRDIISKNPCSGVVCKVDKQILRKDVLSMEEIVRLMQTSYKEQNLEVRRAFIFVFIRVYGFVMWWI